MSESKAHQAIGKAICLFQNLEILIVVSFEFLQMVSSPEYRDISKGCIDPKLYRKSIRRFLERLSKQNNIDPQLEKDISDLVEKRDVLVHRWIREQGWPSADDDAGWSDYESLANEVADESRGIIRLLSGYLLKLNDQEWAQQNPKEYVERVRRLFHDAGKDG